MKRSQPDRHGPGRRGRRPRAAGCVRPLPENVIPSDIFIAHLRRRLLELRPRERDVGKAA